MSKFLQILFALTVLVALCTAEAPRLRSARLQRQLREQQKRRFFARQVLAEEEAAVTPYPVAGIKPEVPFDLPTEVEEQQQDSEQGAEQQPDNTYLPPDNTYGPPPVDEEAEEDINPAVADAEEDAAEAGSTPNQQPAVNDADNEIDENADIIPRTNSQSGRLVSARRLRSRKSAKLQRRQVRGRRLTRS